MTHRILATITASLLIAMPCISAAQSASGDVTFRLPLNLTQMSPDVVKIAVTCSISANAATTGSAQGAASKLQEFAVAGGELVTTAIVVVPVSGLETGPGKTAYYNCSIKGYLSNSEKWLSFDAKSANAAMRLSPTPPQVTGSFVW